ncbi:2279_t:CDS:2 [Paraglomus occultum]|uniref:2279_t:CDS:1 n=1 Tax=Paraglomus occultum TaxID=144539 RepID=A0A9N9CCH7_9GLOM|nr:2279_t:CDS:2 [Paraglomus occultum]
MTSFISPQHSLANISLEGDSSSRKAAGIVVLRDVEIGLKNAPKQRRLGGLFANKTKISATFELGSRKLETITVPLDEAKSAQWNEHMLLEVYPPTSTILSVVCFNANERGVNAIMGECRVDLTKYRILNDMFPVVVVENLNSHNEIVGQVRFQMVLMLPGPPRTLAQDVLASDLKGQRIAMAVIRNVKSSRMIRHDAHLEFSLSSEHEPASTYTTHPFWKVSDREWKRPICMDLVASGDVVLTVRCKTSPSAKATSRTVIRIFSNIAVWSELAKGSFADGCGVNIGQARFLEAGGAAGVVEIELSIHELATWDTILGDDRCYSFDQPTRHMTMTSYHKDGNFSEDSGVGFRKLSERTMSTINNSVRYALRDEPVGYPSTDGDYSLSRETSRATLRSTVECRGTRPVLSQPGYDIPITSSPDHSTLSSPTSSQICLPSSEVRPSDKRTDTYSTPVSPADGTFIYRTDSLHTTSSYDKQFQLPIESAIGSLVCTLYRIQAPLEFPRESVDPQQHLHRNRLYLAIHYCEQVAVVVKLFNSMNLWHNENKYLDELRSNHVVKWKGYSFEQGLNGYVTVTKYYAGKSLLAEADRYAAETAFKPIFERICQAVSFIHEKGVVHLDLKPSNIIFESRTSKKIRICDFEFARPAGTEAPEMYFDNHLTPGFSAPELFQKHVIADFSADVFSLGCIFYYITRRRPLFETEQDLKRPVLSPVDGEIQDEDAARLITSMLDRDPRARPSIQEVLQDPYFVDAYDSHRFSRF